MTNLPKSYLPILESDQAEIIEFFNLLMQQGRSDSHSTEAVPQETAAPPSDVRSLGKQWGISNLE